MKPQNKKKTDYDFSEVDFIALVNDYKDFDQIARETVYKLMRDIGYCECYARQICRW